MVDIDKKRWLNAELTKINYFNQEINHDYIFTLVCPADVCSAIWGKNLFIYHLRVCKSAHILYSLYPPSLSSLQTEPPKPINSISEEQAWGHRPSFRPGIQIQRWRVWGLFSLFVFKVWETTPLPYLRSGASWFVQWTSPWPLRMGFGVDAGCPVGYRWCFCIRWQLV